jgi:hypothetical protein
MHARHNSPLTGRSLSFDPAVSWGLAAPQTWNRYAYTAGNPLTAIDATGQEMLFLVPTTQEAFQDGVGAGIAEFQAVNEHFADGTGNLLVVLPGNPSLEGFSLAGETSVQLNYWFNLGPEAYTAMESQYGKEMVGAYQQERDYAFVVLGEGANLEIFTHEIVHVHTGITNFSKFDAESNESKEAAKKGKGEYAKSKGEEDARKRAKAISDKVNKSKKKPKSSGPSQGYERFVSDSSTYNFSNWE